jgi:hypothetical protein
MISSNLTKGRGKSRTWVNFKMGGCQLVISESSEGRLRTGEGEGEETVKRTP